MRDVLRDLCALAGVGCLVAAGVAIALPLGLAIGGVGLIAVAVATGPTRPSGGTNDGSD